MDYVLRIEGLAGINLSGRDSRKAEGSFVEFYDPSVNEGGEGSLYLTKNLDSAQKFVSFKEAMECWQQSYGIRPDGKPNRPLTAFTVTLLTVAQAEEDERLGV